jgi:hypothetical protein
MLTPNFQDCFAPCCTTFFGKTRPSCPVPSDFWPATTRPLCKPVLSPEIQASLTQSQSCNRTMIIGLVQEEIRRNACCLPSKRGFSCQWSLSPIRFWAAKVPQLHDHICWSCKFWMLMSNNYPKTWPTSDPAESDYCYYSVLKYIFRITQL